MPKSPLVADKIILRNGGVIEREDGTGIVAINTAGTSTTITGTETVVAAEIALSEGNVLVGNSSGVATALSAKTSGRILVGDGTTIASVAVSGDATLSSAGAVTNTKINGKTVSHVPMFGGTAAYGGGGTSTAITVTGAAATDIVFASIQASTNAVSVVKVVPTTNTVTVHFSADPGAATTIQYVVLRAA